MFALEVPFDLEVELLTILYSIQCQKAILTLQTCTEGGSWEWLSIPPGNCLKQLLLLTLL